LILSSTLGAIRIHNSQLNGANSRQSIGSVQLYVTERLFVRANLRHALDMLSQPPSKFGFPCQRYIWIDSICINQKDSTEKNAKVSVVADIYQTAARFLVWIGGMGEFSDDAFSALHQLSVIPTNAHEMVRADDWWSHEDVFPSKLGIESPL
jgi:Heterokaryon incompatibility protein (HET)